MTLLRPFFRYYGGKWRAAPRYPAPRYRTIIEPFAGSAGYSLRHPQRDVILVEKYDVVAEIWRYLIGTPATEILRLPCVDHVEEIPSWVPEGGRLLIRMTMANSDCWPRNHISTGALRRRAQGRTMEGWTEARRDLTARQVDAIRHWKIIEGDWSEAPTFEATRFFDPPYTNKAGEHYSCGPDEIDFDALATAIRDLPGQAIVCENEGASWLPFEAFELRRSFNNPEGAMEVVYEQGTPRQRELFG